MKIAMVVSRSWPAIGGVESLLRSVAQELASEHEVVVVARSAGGEEGNAWVTHGPDRWFDAFDDGPVRTIPLTLERSTRLAMMPLSLTNIRGLGRFAYSPARALLAPGFARTAGAGVEAALRGTEVVHSWSGEFAGVAALGIARRLGVPLAVTAFPHRGQYGEGPVDRWLYRRADACLGLLRADAQVYTDAGCPATRVHVVGAGVPPIPPAADPVAVADGSKLIVFLGARRPYKGYDSLIGAIPRVRGVVPDSTFAFIGPGAAVPEADGNSVIDVGEVDERTKHAWLERADLVCLPSEHEIFPITFLEAWQHRTAVVGSDIASLRELMEISGGGITSPREPESLAEAVISLLTDDERRVALADSGHRFASGYGTVEATAQRHVAVYRQLLEAR